MGQAAYGAAGAIIGFVVTGFNPTGAYWGWAIGSAIGASQQTIRGPKLGDARGNYSQDGVIRPIILGTGCVGCNHIDGTDPEEVEVDVDGGKGGPQQTENRWIRKVIVLRCCEAIPDGALLKVWRGEKLVYDVTPDSTILAESAEFEEKMVVMLGGDTQGVRPELEAIHGVGNAPYYRDSCCVMLLDHDCTDAGGAVPPFRFEFTAGGSTFTSGVGVVTDIRSYRGLPPTEVVDNTAWPANTDRLAVSSSGYVAAARSATNNGQVAIYKYIEEEDEYEFLHYLPGIPDTRRVFSLAWHPNGRILAVGTDSIGEGPERQFTYLRDGDSLSLASKFPTSGSGGVSSYCRFSDSGRKLAFTGPSTTNCVEVYEVNPASGEISERKQANFGAGTIARRFDFMPGSDGRYLAISGGTSDTTFVRLIDTQDDVMVVVATGEASENLGIELNKGVFFTGPTQIVTFPGGQLWSVNPNFSTMGYIGTSGIDPGGAATRWYDASLGGEFIGVARAVTNDPNIQVWRSSDWTQVSVPPAGSSQTVSVVAFAQVETGVVVTPGATDLQTVCQFIRSLSTLPESRLDATELASTKVDGLVLSNDGTPKDNLETLGGIYLFDTPEYDGQIHCSRRGKPIVATIPEGELIDTGDEIEVQMREEGRQYPRKLHFQYENAETGYQATKQTAPRGTPATRSQGEVAVQSPVYHPHDEAAQLAEIHVKVLRAEAEGTAEFSLPWKYLRLVPSNCIGAVVSGKLRRLRIDEQTISDGELPLKLVVDRQSNYTSNVQAIAPVPPTPPAPTLEGNTLFAFLNLPALTESDDRPGFRVIAAGQLPGWRGAVIERSVDGGDTFQAIASFGRGAVIGTLVDDFGFSPGELVDTTRTLRVQVPQSVVFDSITQAQLQRRGNACALVSNSEPDPEVIQFRDAVEESPGIWALTYIPRGLLNTEPRAWAAGTRLCVLSGSLFLPRPIAEEGATMIFRAVSLNQSPEDAPEVTRTWSPVMAQREWAPLNLVVSRDGGNLTLSVTPRWRLGTTINPVRSADFDGWRWVVDGTAYTTATPTLTITDPGPDVPVSVAGLNRVTGPGEALEEIA